MKKLIALSVLGKDKTGIVAAIAKVLYETGCNIEDSSMTQLRNEFAMILLVELSDTLSADKLHSMFKPAADEFGLSISSRALISGEAKVIKAKGTPYIISVFGADQAGIVYRVSEFLAKNKINITDVQTSISEVQKKMVYTMLIETHIPESFDIKTLKSKLDEIAVQLNVSITAHPIDVAEL